MYIRQFINNYCSRLIRSSFWKYKKYPCLIGFLFALSLIYLIRIIQIEIYAIILLDSRMLPRSPIGFIAFLILPIILFIWASAFDFYNYYLRKTIIIYYSCANALILLMGQLLRILIPMLVPLILKIPVSHEVTISMIVNLARGTITLAAVVPVICIGSFLLHIIDDPYNRSILLHFKVMKYLDLRNDKQFRYDFKVITELNTGKMYTVKEKDRTLHGFADGTTGTAKTSSVLTNGICNDLNQKVYNENYQRKQCIHYLNTKEFEVTRPFTDKTFSINYIKPVLTGDKKQDETLKKKYDYLKYTAQTIGLTCIAPNESFADEIYEMATLRGIAVNRVDPILTSDGKQKTGFCGFNPLAVSPLLSGVARDVDITNKATIFADVLQGLYEASGSGDAYFISLNNSVTIAICKLLMLTFAHLHNRQPHPGDVQLCINDFSRCEPYLQELVKNYGNFGEPMDEVRRAETEDRVRYDVQSDQRKINCGLWHDVYTLIQNDLLGPNKDNMFDRANGLRLQINNFLNHPLIRRVLCSEQSIDLDQALANGEITVVNYALELGKSVSSAFGLFYLLSLSKAVLRRPGTESTRTLHMIYIDELSFLLHPSLEEFFSIFRQYKVGNFVAFQTLDQMDKNETTKYLKGVFLGNCAHQIVFGRVSPTEMKIYETMGGKVMKPIEQYSTSETSITSENPSYNYSMRSTEQLGNLIEGHEIRNRDFQEVTFFTVNDSSPVPPFAGKVHFLDAARRQGTPLQQYDWSIYMPAEQTEPGFHAFSSQKQSVAVKMQTVNTELTAAIHHTRKVGSQNHRFTARGIDLTPSIKADDSVLDTSLEKYYAIKQELPNEKQPSASVISKDRENRTATNYELNDGGNHDIRMPK